MKNAYLLLVLISIFSSQLALGGNPVSGNSKDSSRKNIAISIVPQYTLANGFRMDFEFRLADKHWLMFAPIYYMGSKREGFGPFSNSDKIYDVEGYGADLYDKIFLKKNSSPFGPYLAVGVKYHHFSIDYKDYTWQEYDEGGLKYYDYVYTTVNETIDRYGANLVFGYQKDMFKGNMLADFFVGYGLKISDVKLSDDTKDEIFTSRFWDYGYAGPHLLLGVRLGVLF